MARLKSNSAAKAVSLLIFVMALTAQSICPSQALCGAQADRAIAAVKQLIASGKIAEDTTLRIVAKEGNINNFWGRNLSIKNQWEEKTGIMLDARVRPNLPVLEFMRKTKEFDITVARQREYPDLYLENLIIDLTPFVKKHGFTIDENSRDGFFRVAAQTTFDNKIVAIPADGDISVLYLRQDLLEDPIYRAEFKNRYQKALKPPNTWEDYQELIEFFHRPNQGLYGTCEHRDPQTSWMFWMQRYACQAYPNQYLFDKNMHPLIDSPAGWTATESFLKTVPYSPPEICKEGNHYTYSMPIFRDGKAFAYIITMAGAKMFNADRSAVKGKFMVSLMPGKMTGNRLLRRTSFIYGNNIVVASSSSQKELAFLFAMWFSDPDISIKSIEVTSGIADPFRFNHAKESSLWPLYTRQALELLDEQFKIAVPAGTGLPGDNEYMQTLSRNLWLAAQGKMTARETMKKTAAKWEQITAKYGRERQIHYWEKFIKEFPQ